MKTEYLNHYYGKKLILQFYREQLLKFNKLGIGNFTENSVEVTQKLIDTTKKRIRHFSALILDEKKTSTKERLADVHKRENLESICRDNSS
jgi:hypothetical protein